MAHAQNGDAAAYRRLLREISPWLRKRARARCSDPHDAEDAVQDILLTLHAIRHTYDPARPFGPWIAAIADRRLIDRLRSRGRRAKRETALTEEHETFPSPETNDSDKWSDHRALHAAVKNLPSGQAQAIELLKLKEMSLKEASEASGVSVAALKVATHRALHGLRKMLSGSEGGQ